MPTRGSEIARTNSLKLIQIKILVDEASLEVYTIGRRQIDPDLIHTKPQKESSDLNPFQLYNRPVAELTRDNFVIIYQVIELYVARILQNDDESTVLRERVAGYRVR